MTGIVTASWISLITAGFDMRATPPWARMAAGTRSSAITAQAPASSATFACSAVVTSMITPPLSISARPVFTLNVAGSGTGRSIVEGARARPLRGPDENGAGGLPRWSVGNLCSTSSLGGTGRGGVNLLGVLSPGPRYQLQVRIAPRACGFFMPAFAALFQLEGADPIAVGGLVPRVHAVGQRLDEAHQGRVRADI